MSAISEKIDIPSNVTKSVEEVFGTMLNLPAEPLAGIGTEDNGERVSGTIGIVGENVSGTLYLHLTAPLARKAASAMLGMTEEELGDGQEVSDVVGEVTNMVCGNLKSALCDLDLPCAMSTPAIIRGRQFRVEAAPGLDRFSVWFASASQPFCVEVHLKDT
jgi:chemotaxis protein CheX